MFTSTVFAFHYTCLITCVFVSTTFVWALLRLHLPDRLITYSPLHFGRFVWWLIRAQNKLQISTNLSDHFDLICLITYSSLLHPYKFRLICLITSTLFVWSTNLPDHFDLICLITYSSLLHPYKFRSIWLITSTLFVWSLIPRYISADLRDDLFEHKTMFTHPY